jgi:uncharacterized membrane protein YGL010W
MTQRPDGAFGWKRRMGVHEAYHQRGANRVLHWLLIPVELWAVVKLLAWVPLPAGLDLGLLVILTIAPVYLATELVLGGLMVGFLLACWTSAGALLVAPSPLAVLGVLLLFAVSFGLQVAVGHGVFEQGRDDTDKNLRELAQTKNPIPILLVFYYHLVEIALLLGYRPALRRQIADFTREELELGRRRD